MGKENDKKIPQQVATHRTSTIATLKSGRILAHQTLCLPIYSRAENAIHLS